MNETTGRAAAPIIAERAPRKGRWRRWLLRITAVLLILVGAVVLLVPVVASSDFVKTRVVAAIQESVNAGVAIDAIDFSWQDGITVRGLVLENPPGFPQGEAVRVESAYAAVSYTALARGRIKAKLRLDRPLVRVHVLESGRINLAELARSKPAGEPQPEPGAEPKPETTRAFDARIELLVSDGRIEIDDQQHKLAQEIRDLDITCANRDFGAPLQATLDCVVAPRGASASGSVHVTTQVDPARLPIVDWLDFKATGIELAAYEPLVAAYLPQRFESFRGRVEGYVSAKPDADGAYLIVGDLEVTNVDVRGGPMGPGKGIVAKRWHFEPNLSVHPQKLTGRVEGTRADLGFAKLRALPPGEARTLLPDAVAEPLAVELTVDLAELAKQPIVPEGTWEGRVTLRAGLVPASGGASPFRATLRGDALRVAGSFLPDGAEVPRELALDVSGTLDPGKDGAPLSASGTYQLTAPGIDAGGKWSKAGADYTAALEASVDPEGASGMIAPFLPSGMTLSERATLALEARGSLPANDKAGGLLAGTLAAKGTFRAPTVRYLGNELTGLEQALTFEGDKLAVTPVSPAKLNGGPLTLNVGLAQAAGDRRVDFELAWREGRAAGGLTPLLQYAVPLLAGLPTRDLDKVTGIDFTSTARLALKGGGPLPREGATLLAALESWTAEGALELKNGSFQPSTAFGSIFQMLGKSKLAFDDIKTGIRIDGGKVITQGFKLGGKDGTLELAGSTTLAGKLDVRIDFTGLLAAHKDGRRALELLGGKKLEAGLGGTLWSPALQVEELMTGMLRNALQGVVEDAAKKALDDLLKGKKPDLNDILKGLKKKQ